MSFSNSVKEELLRIEEKEACCVLAEETGKAVMEGRLSLDKEEDKKYINVYFRKNTKLCCKRSFLRGVFMSTGFINHPQKSYYLELDIDDKNFSIKLEKLMIEIGLRAKSLVRRNKYIVYLKDRESISLFLNIVGAYEALMELENYSILKEVSNNENRLVNFEVANLDRTIVTAVRQKKAIGKIVEKVGIGALPPKLREVAELRLKEQGDISIEMLANKLETPISKSGLNHRLKKIEEFAESLD